MNSNNINNKTTQKEGDLHAKIAHCLAQPGVAPRQ